VLVKVSKQILQVLVWTLVCKCEWVWVWECCTCKCMQRLVMWHTCHLSKAKEWYGVDNRGWAKIRYQRRERKADGEWEWVRGVDSLAHLLQRMGCHIHALLLQVMVMIINN
jgi:hypothetical protein